MPAASTTFRPDARTRLTAVLGHPISHTLSPLIHNAAFRAANLNLVYLAFDVRPEQLEHAVNGLRTIGFAGANITIPHKQAICPFLDRLTPAARAVGAVNTIVPSQSEGGAFELVGDNTDVDGFLAPLRDRSISIAGSDAVVFGAGGAAHAVVYALLTGSNVRGLTVVARRSERAAALCRKMAPHAPGTSIAWTDFSHAHETVSKARIVVNCTPVGMAPESDHSPWQDPSAIRGGQLWYDLIYNPAETAFLRQARQAGAGTVSGLDMFVAQASAAFVQWTGQQMPESVVREVLRDWFDL